MADRSGQDLGHYRLVRLLGTGGFADVYLAEHRTLATFAAIKVLNMHLATQDHIDQFSQEAYLIARLIHPHIVRVLDFGVEGDVPFLVMDYAPHGTLRQQYPEGTLVPLWNILSAVRQVADALQYAHDHQLIHRDIKPENLLLGRQGEIWLSDFGIAVVAHHTNSLPTQDNVHTVGTLAYMAPEQLRGEPRPASDQYALAIVVYEWLTGKRPFSGTPLELIYQQQHVSPAPLQRAGRAIPQEVEAVVLKALAKNPKGRFSSVQAFVTALEQASEEAAFPEMVSPPNTTASSSSTRTPQEAWDMLPTTILPETPSSQPSNAPPLPSSKHIQQEEPQEATTQAGEQPFGELTTLPEHDQANHPPPFSFTTAARPSPHRKRRALLAAGLLALALGTILLTLFSGLLSSSPGKGQTSTSNPATTLGSPVSGSATRPGADATDNTHPTPVGNAPTGEPSPTGATTPNPLSTATSTPAPSQLAVTPLALNFTLSLVNCLVQNPSQMLTVKNTGGSGLSWQAAIQNPAYLTIDQSTGDLDTGQMVQITVSLACKVVVHTTDAITFTSNSGDMVVVIVTITLS